MTTIKLRAFYLMRSILVTAVDLFPAFVVGCALGALAATICVLRGC